MVVKVVLIRTRCEADCICVGFFFFFFNRVIASQKQGHKELTKNVDYMYIQQIKDGINKSYQKRPNYHVMDNKREIETGGGVDVAELVQQRKKDNYRSPH